MSVASSVSSCSDSDDSSSVVTEVPSFRVRQLLSSLNPVETATLKKLLPKGVTKVPVEPAGVRYPAALLSALNSHADGEEYSLLGFICEDLLHLDAEQITLATLETAVHARAPETDMTKVLRSKTTEPFLEHIRNTRVKLQAIAKKDEKLQGETEVGSGILVGHPDMRTTSQIFEIKMTGQLKKNWISFLLQVFAYAALDDTVTDVYLVLPLQEMIQAFSVNKSGWKDTHRMAFRATLLDAATKRIETEGDAKELIEKHDIGCHVSKKKSLADTVLDLPHPSSRPYQIFLSGPQSAHMSLHADDIAEAHRLIKKFDAKLYVHSQYLINLCTPPPVDGSEETLHTGLLIKNLQYATKLGASGVVVHVGKSTTQDIPTALAHMRANILRAMEHATEECPILLETPAGQGTETLRTYEEFVEFVAAFDDDRLRICVDTCHVFACGSSPEDYIKRLNEEHPDLLALIHFNDSATPCGSCLDRHAFIGQGNIGMDGMTRLAELGSDADVPMLIEY